MPTKKGIISDPLFGKVQAEEYWWYGKHQSAWTGDVVDLILPLEDEGPTEVQRRLYQEFRANEPSLKGVVERAICNWYREYVEEEAGDFDYAFPDVKRPSEIWKAINFTSVCIPDRNDDDRFEVLFGGEWEEEHGFLLAFKKWKVVKVLYQGSGY